VAPLDHCVLACGVGQKLPEDRSWLRSNMPAGYDVMVLSLKGISVLDRPDRVPGTRGAQHVAEALHKSCSADGGIIKNISSALQFSYYLHPQKSLS